ncbi:MAG: 2-phospho-L-lactate guanylyltransferase [Actinomycetota bacterium]|nr:2-phospho-L-lactate guanylyltransferase [Actinomycetota bacterium]
MDAGIIPVKRLDRAKKRLADDFDEEQRVAIARALLDDALDLCHGSPFLSWWVVSDDEAVLERAKERRLSTLQDGGSGLNDALVLAIATVASAGAKSTTIIPVDVPLAQPEDLQDLLDTGATSDITVVPSERDGGTNGLYLRPPGILAPRFGPGSLASHLAAAERAGVRCSILSLDALSLDIDTVEDIQTLLSIDRASRTKTAALLADISRRVVPKPS